MNQNESFIQIESKNKELYTFLSLEKSLVYFTTSLKSNKVVLNKILRFNYLRMYEEDKDLLEDVIIENGPGDRDGHGVFIDLEWDDGCICIYNF